MCCFNTNCRQNETEQNRIIIIERGPRGPRGFTGPQGPQGPQGIPGVGGTGLLSYGGLYSATSTVQALTTANTNLVMGSGMPARNVVYGTNTITVNNGGVYEVNYKLNGSLPVADDLNLVVAVNGVALPQTNTVTTYETDENKLSYGTALVTLNAGDVISLQSSVTTTPTNLTTANGANTVLTVKQIS